ncbi:MAG: DUF4145 domain-containing protein [Verrucomicrobiae bacterium]|nr:DUF4145 domain-containing protein [Verrucomicrobiae bacterium]
MPVSIYCPHCHRHVSLVIMREQSGDPFMMPSRSRLWWMGLCPACGDPVMVGGRNDNQALPQVVEVIFPTPQPPPTNPMIPDRVRKDLVEAKICIASNCFTAAAILARRSLERACLLKGASDGSLVQMIRQLASDGVITRDLAEWATEVRVIGNTAAHPRDEEFSSGDAEDCVELTEQFLKVLFVIPVLASLRKANRELPPPLA